jgi:hypothetical protein
MARHRSGAQLCLQSRAKNAGIDATAVAEFRSQHGDPEMQTNKLTRGMIEELRWLKLYGANGARKSTRALLKRGYISERIIDLGQHQFDYEYEISAAGIAALEAAA